MNIKNWILIFLILFSATISFGQMVTLGDASAYANSDTSVAITVDGMNNINAFTFHVSYDPAVVDFIGLSNQAVPGILANVTGSVINIEWYSVAPFSPSGVLCRLNFFYKGSSCDLLFLSGCEVTHGAIPFLVGYSNGSISQHPCSASGPKADIGSLVCAPGEVVSLPVNLSDFPNVGAFTQYIKFDPAKLTFVGIMAGGNLSGTLANQSNGVVTIDWVSSTGYGRNINTVPASANFLKLAFKRIFQGSALVSFNPGNQFTTGYPTPENIQVCYSDGEITDAPATDFAFLGALSGVIQGSEIAVPLQLAIDNPISAFTLNLNFNSPVLSYIGTELVDPLPPTASLTANHVSNTLTIVYTNTNPSVLPYSTFLNLRFHYNGMGVGHVDFGSNSEFVDETFVNLVNTAMYNSTITPGVSMNSAIVQIESVPATYNSEVDVPVEIDGGNSNPLGAATMFIKYDNNKMSFVGAIDNIYNAAVGSNENQVIIAWADVAGQNFNGTLLKLRFHYTGGAGTGCGAVAKFVNSKFTLQACQLADVTGAFVPASWQDGGVNVEPVQPVIIGPAQICLNSYGNIYNTEPFMINYSWIVNGGSITAGGSSSVNTASVMWNSVGNQSVQVNYTNPGGCRATNPTVFPVNVSSASIPDIPGSIIGTTNVVQGQNNISYTVAPINGATGYVWQFPAGVLISGGLNTNTVTVSFTANASSGTITVFGTNECGNGPYSPSLYVNVITTIPNQMPTVQASSVTFSNISLNQMNVNWLDGNGYKRVVFIRQDSVGMAIPVNNTTYMANTAFGMGSQIDNSGWYCIFNGITPPEAITVTNLQPNTKYRVMVCEYNGVYGSEKYNTTAALNNPKSQKTCFPVMVSVSISASLNPVCEGTSVTLTAAPINGGLMPGFQWQKGGIDIIGATSFTYNDIPISGDVFTCVLSSSDLCASSNPASSNAITMTVNQLLPVILAISASSNPICAGTSVTFTASPTNGGTTPAYQWKKAGTTITGATNSTYTYAPANGDVITCVLTSNATCPTGSPATSNSITMSVTPSAPVSVTIFASSTYMCEGTSASLFANPANGGSSPVYQWKVNGTNVGTNNQFLIYTPATNDVVTCHLTSNIACPSGNPATSNTITMTVNPNLPVSVSVSASSNPVCAGTGVTFTATPTNGGTTPTYAWKKGGTAISGATSNTYNYVPLNGDIITCELTSNAACPVGSPATSNAITMTVNALPAPTIMGPAAVCINSVGNVYTTESSMSNYSWQVIGGIIQSGGSSGNNTVMVTWTTQGTQSVKVNYTNANGCAAANPTNYPVAVSSTNAPAQPGVITGPTTVAPGQVNVSYSVAPVSGATGYLWQFPSGATITAGLNTNAVTVTFAANAISGTVTVCGTSDCGNGPLSPGLFVHVGTTVPPAVYLQNLVLSGGANNCYNATQVIYVALNGGYFRVLSGSSATLIAGKTIIFYPGTVVFSGGYMHGYITTSNQYCSPLKIGEVVAMGETEPEESPWSSGDLSFRVYPNPTSGKFTLELSEPTKSPVRIQCLNLIGVQVLEAEINDGNISELTLAGQKPGIYLLRVSRGNESGMKKIVRY